MDLEQFGHLRLSPSMIIDQVHNLTLLRRKFFHFLVELAPTIQVTIIVTAIRWVEPRLAVSRVVLHAGVVCADACGP